MHATQSRFPRPRRRGAASPSALVLGTCLMATGLLSSCADDDDPVSTLRVPTVARFAPSAGIVPVPNDLLFSGSTDGTLNIPIADPANTADPAIALNTLDGWSTTGPIAIEFSRALDPATVVAGSSIFLFEVTAFPMPAVGGPVQTVDAELQEGVDYVVALPTEGEGRTVVIQPLRPLQPSSLPNAGGNSVYMVVVTNGVTDVDGEPVQRDTEYLFAAAPMLGTDPPPPESLVQLNGLINSQLNAFDAVAGIPATREDVVMSFTFTTQSVGAALQTIRGIAAGNEQLIIDTLCPILGTCGPDTGLNPFSTPLINQVNTPNSFLGTASELLGGAPNSGAANIYAGIFKAPYYLDASMNAAFAGLTNDATSLTTPWRSRYAFEAGDTARNVTRFNALPVATSCQQMPLLISIPVDDPVNNPRPANGWPVVIFQHGIGGDRAAMLLVAEALAAEGLAAVSIDLPLHGREFNDPLPSGLAIFVGYDNALPQTDDVWERTFGIDLLTETPGELPMPGPDGVADSSGAHFINLSNLAVTRDNLRQGVSDLINLKAALGTLLIQGVDETDETQVHFMGHSLGGIVGTPFVANEPDLVAASLGMAGSSLPYLLNGSASFGPVIRGGLASAGIVDGTPEFGQFLAAAQAVIDVADPINYTSFIASSTTPIYFAEVIGGGPGGGLSDLVIPNTVPGAPFAGSTPLVQALGLTQESMTLTTIPGDPAVRAVVRFVEGNHSSLLAPNLLMAPTVAEQAASAELQAQIAGFHGSGGLEIPMTDLTVVE